MIMCCNVWDCLQEVFHAVPGVLAQGDLAMQAPAPKLSLRRFGFVRAIKAMVCSKPRLAEQQAGSLTVSIAS